MNIIQQVAYGTKGYEILFQQPKHDNINQFEPDFDEPDFDSFNPDSFDDFEPVDEFNDFNEFDDDFNEFNDFNNFNDSNDDLNEFNEFNDFNEPSQTFETINQELVEKPQTKKPLSSSKPKTIPDITIKRAIEVKIPTDLHTLLNYNYDDTAENWLKQHGFND